MGTRLGIQALAWNWCASPDPTLISEGAAFSRMKTLGSGPTQSLYNRETEPPGKGVPALPMSDIRSDSSSPPGQASFLMGG